MRIFSWNVNGLPTTLLDVRNRYTCISTYFKDYLHADIVCFQEAKVQEERLDKVLACVPGYESFWAFSRTRKGYSGVVTYVREELSPLEAEADCLQGPDEDICREGRVMCTDHGTFLLFNVYVPNAGDRSEGRPRLAFKLAFLHALRRKMDEALRLGKHVILVGDLNVSYRQADVFHQWRLEDIFGPEELRWFHELLEEYVDLFHHLHPDAQDVFSVWNQKTSGRIHNEGQRIDFTICDKGFLDQVLSAEVIKMSPQKWSDHAAVAVSLTEQPALAPHAPPTLSSRHMARFREDTKQRKLTSLFGVKQLSKTSSALVRPPIVPESDREAAKTGQLDYCKEPVGKQNPQGHQAVVQANENDSYLPAVGVARPSYGEEAGAGRAVASGRSDSAVNAGNVDASSLDGGGANSCDTVNATWLRDKGQDGGLEKSQPKDGQHSHVPLVRDSLQEPHTAGSGTLAPGHEHEGPHGKEGPSAAEKLLENLQDVHNVVGEPNLQLDGNNVAMKSSKVARTVGKRLPGPKSGKRSPNGKKLKPNAPLKQQTLNSFFKGATK